MKKFRRILALVLASIMLLQPAMTAMADTAQEASPISTETAEQTEESTETTGEEETSAAVVEEETSATVVEEETSSADVVEESTAAGGEEPAVGGEEPPEEETSAAEETEGAGETTAAELAEGELEKQKTGDTAIFTYGLKIGTLVNNVLVLNRTGNFDFHAVDDSLTTPLVAHSSDESVAKLRLFGSLEQFGHYSVMNLFAYSEGTAHLWLEEEGSGEVVYSIDVSVPERTAPLIRHCREIGSVDIQDGDTITIKEDDRIAIDNIAPEDLLVEYFDENQQPVTVSEYAFSVNGDGIPMDSGDTFISRGVTTITVSSISEPDVTLTFHLEPSVEKTIYYLPYTDRGWYSVRADMSVPYTAAQYEGSRTGYKFLYWIDITGGNRRAYNAGEQIPLSDPDHAMYLEAFWAVSNASFREVEAVLYAYDPGEELYCDTWLVRRIDGKECICYAGADGALAMDEVVAIAPYEYEDIQDIHVPEELLYYFDSEGRLVRDQWITHMVGGEKKYMYARSDGSLAYNGTVSAYGIAATVDADGYATQISVRLQGGGPGVKTGDGNGYVDVSVDANGNFTLPQNTFINGTNEFLGWVVKKTDKALLYQPGESLSVDHVFETGLSIYAAWRRDGSTESWIRPIDGKQYYNYYGYFLRNAWKQKEGSLCRIGDDGTLVVNGWFTDEAGDRYRTNENGAMVKGWSTVTDENGYVHSVYLKDDGKAYVSENMSYPGGTNVFDADGFLQSAYQVTLAGLENTDCDARVLCVAAGNAGFMTLPAPESQTAYFEYWTLGENGARFTDADLAGITSDITLYPHWRPFSSEINEVNYYCSVGAYLATLQQEINQWNAGEGRQKGVKINLISNVNTYSTDLKALLESGTHYDLMDVNTSHQDWIEKGWVMDLRTIRNDDLEDLIESYEPYIQNGINIQAGHLHALPSEVVPIKMAVNLDLFAKNGLELPETWDDVYQCAKVITENGNGIEFGYGATTWGSLWSRLTFKASMSSTGRGWWDPNTETYDWSQFKVPAETLKQMYEDGYTIGMDYLAIDPIRAQFAEGVIGMFPAPSYDYGVYTSQFPAQCNWAVIDMPTIEAGEAPYKGVYLDRTGCSIDKVSYNAANSAKKAAIAEAFVFLNSDYLNQKLYESGGMIPYKQELIETATVDPNLGEQWVQFADIENYTSMSLFPDSLLPLQGNKANVCFQNWCHTPGQSFESVAADLAQRYNAAYQELKLDGEVDLSAYSYTYNTARVDDGTRRVTFASTGDSEIPAQVITTGSTATRPAEDPVWEGYDFINWYRGNSVYDFTTPVTRNITLTAKWNAHTYNVTFNGNDQAITVPAATTVKCGQRITKPQVPETRTGYELTWCLDPEGEEEWNFNTMKMPAHDLTLYAMWKEVTYIETNEITYYCSIGAYLTTLQEEIDKYNEGEGREQGVYINLISNVNTYSTDLTAMLESGVHYDLMDVNTSHQDWIENGWVMDLRTIENEELEDLIESYEPYIQNGINIQAGHLHALPSEVVPIKMVVNLDLFEKNNLDLPETWDDVYQCAKVITENGNNVEFGYGGTTWGSLWSRLTFKASMSSTGRGWWDPNTETYSWSQFKKPAETLKKMYEDGYTIGMDDLAIDPIRAQFAAGFVGMFPAPSYDYGVYTSVFPAQCNWTVIDMPTISGTAQYKGVYLDRTGCSIDKVSYNNSTEARKKAIEKAFIFLNSDYLNQKIYESGGMIPYKQELIETATVDPALRNKEQWELFADLENYTSMSLFPDSRLPLVGKKANVSFQDWCHTPNQSFESVAADVAQRYNAAYQELKRAGNIDLSVYHYTYNISRSANAGKYKVSFLSNGHGTAPAPVWVKSGAKLPAIEDPVASGWVFTGWYRDEACTNQFDLTTDRMPASNLKLYAGWTRKVVLEVAGEYYLANAWDALQAKFEANYPWIELKLVGVGQNMAEFYTKRLSDGEELPAIMTVDCDETYQNMVQDDFLEDLNDRDVAAVIPQSYKDAYTYDDTLYGITLGAASDCMVYNMQLLQLAGVTKVPTNWTEFLACCKKLDAAGLIALCYAGKKNTMGWMLFESIAANVIDAKEGDGTFVRMLREKECIDWTMYPEVAQRMAAVQPYLLDGCSTMTEDDVMCALENGACAIALCGSWSSSNAIAAIGKASGKTDYAAITLPPFNTAGTVCRYAATPEAGIGLAKVEDPEIEAARDLFFDWFFEPENYSILQTACGLFPVMTNIPGSLIGLNAAQKAYITKAQAGTPFAMSFNNGTVAENAEIRNVLNQISTGEVSATAGLNEISKILSGEYPAKRLYFDNWYGEDVTETAEGYELNRTGQFELNMRNLDVSKQMEVHSSDETVLRPVLNEYYYREHGEHSVINLFAYNAGTARIWLTESGKTEVLAETVITVPEPTEVQVGIPHADGTVRGGDCFLIENIHPDDLEYTLWDDNDKVELWVGTNGDGLLQVYFTIIKEDFDGNLTVWSKSNPDLCKTISISAEASVYTPENLSVELTTAGKLRVSWDYEEAYDSYPHVSVAYFQNGQIQALFNCIGNDAMRQYDVLGFVDSTWLSVRGDIEKEITVDTQTGKVSFDEAVFPAFIDRNVGDVTVRVICSNASPFEVGELMREESVPYAEALFEKTLPSDSLEAPVLEKLTSDFIKVTPVANAIGYAGRIKVPGGRYYSVYTEDPDGIFDLDWLGGGEAGNYEIAVHAVANLNGNWKNSADTALVAHPESDSYWTAYNRLRQAVQAGRALLADTQQSSNGKDVLYTGFWAASSTMTAYRNAITAAQKALGDQLAPAKLTAAETTFTKATASFEKARKAGLVIPANSAAFEKDEASVGVGCKLTLHFIQMAAEEGVVSNETVTWTSSDPTVATVDAKGVVTGKKAGEVTVTAETGSSHLSASCAVTVVQPITAIKLADSKLALAIEGEEASTSVIITDKTGTAVTDYDVTFDERYVADAHVDGTDPEAILVVVPGDKAVTSTKVTVKDLVSGKSASVTVAIGLPADLVTTTLKSTKVCLTRGKNTTLKATAVIEDPAKPGTASRTKPISADVVWASDDMDEEIITIDAKGKVTAVGFGRCTVTAYAKVGSSDCEPLTFDVVVAPEVKSFSLTDPETGKKASSVTLTVDEDSVDISEYAVIEWKNKGEEDDYGEYEDLLYSVDKEAYAEIDEDGVLTGLKAGSVKVTVTMESTGKTATVTATIREAANVVTTTLKSTKVCLTKGKNTTLKAAAQLKDEDGTIRKEKPISAEVEWVSDDTDEEFITIDARGKVTAVGFGRCTVTAYAKVGSSDCEPLTFDVVVAPEVKNFSLTDPETGKKASPFVLTVGGESIDVSEYVVIAWKNTEEVDDYGEYEDLLYSVDKEAYAEIDEDGVLTGLKAGSVKVTVTMESTGKTATVTAIIREAANVVTTTLKSTKVCLTKGKNTTLKAAAQLKDEDGTIRKEKPISAEVIWGESSDEGVATVDAKGKVIAVGLGRCTVTAYAKVPSDDCEPLEFEIIVAPELKSFKLLDPKTGKAASTAYMAVGGDTIDLSKYPDIQWKVQGEDYTDYENVSYTSDKPGIVEVDEDGILTAVAAGSAKITVTMESTGKTASITVKTGNGADFVSTTAKSTEVSLKVGKSTTLKATAGILDETTGKASTKVKPVTSGVYWESSNEDVATVDPASGKVTAVGEGTCTITARPIAAAENYPELTFEITVTP